MRLQAMYIACNVDDLVALEESRLQEANPKSLVFVARETGAQEGDPRPALVLAPRRCKSIYLRFTHARQCTRYKYPGGLQDM